MQKEPQHEGIPLLVKTKKMLLLQPHKAGLRFLFFLLLLLFPRSMWPSSEKNIRNRPLFRKMGNNLSWLRDLSTQALTGRHPVLISASDSHLLTGRPLKKASGKLLARDNTKPKRYDCPGRSRGLGADSLPHCRCCTQLPWPHMGQLALHQHGHWAFLDHHS